MARITYGCIALFLFAWLATGRVIKDQPSDDELKRQIQIERGMHPNDQFLQSKPNGFTFKRTGEETNEFWLKEAKNIVQKRSEQKLNEKQAKNMIFFLGDGMSVATLAATRVYKGGEEVPLSMEQFSYSGFSKTYCVNTQVTDSAASATAYQTGVKTNYGMLGLTARVPRYDCLGHLDPANHTHSIAQWAMDAGKVAGFVTTTKVTDASPAGLYAHISNRYWENNQDILDAGCSDQNMDDVAEQLVYGEVGKRFKVILGGGRQEFRNEGMVDEENGHNFRSDGKDLIQEWIASKGNERTKYVWNATDLLAINASETDNLMGLFEPSHCRYHLEVLDEKIEAKEPSLAEMTRKAIEILSKHKDGFYLFVEGGRIDLAHHSNYARIALDETSEFDKAIQTAREMLSRDDSLIVVTADHSHLLSYSGYAYRSNDIFGIAETKEIIRDDIPFLTLNYFDGPGNKNFMNKTSGVRLDQSKFDRSRPRFEFPASVKRSTSSHGGEDVVVYADGPWAHLFSGVLEQNSLPHLMAYAGCIGDGVTLCKD